ncbi:MAG: Asp-tRNA(Asn)/Glu-tRNA(Gln) amidotransferase subunit GatB [bacterium]
MNDNYEVVIGLEIHAQLLTKSKAFSSDSTNFGDFPNTNTSPTSLGHPGTLPTINERMVKFAIKAGLATNCTIREVSLFSRKNYFYHDLPKGYQITQYEDPICYDGYINIEREDGTLKKIGITRIHIEEDTGKSIYDDCGDILLDFNRAGLPLIEIVSEPDLRSASEAYQYLMQFRQILMYLWICSGIMEDGALRCDVNVSIRLKGDTKLGTKTEIKNLNSFRNIEKAIDYEVERQIKQIENGEKIIQETRLWDENQKITRVMRSKEEVNDYRYFPEPDLPPLKIPVQWLDELRNEIPELPLEKKSRLMNEYHIPAYDAEIFIQDRDLADYYEKCCSYLLVKDEQRFKLVSNWVMNDVLRYLSDNHLSASQLVLKPEYLAQMIELVANDDISNTIAKAIFPEIAKGIPPKEVIAKKGLSQDFDTQILEELVKIVLADHRDSVEKYKSGRTHIMSFFVSELMKETEGKANPKMINELLMKYLL